MMAAQSAAVPTAYTLVNTTVCETAPRLMLAMTPIGAAPPAVDNIDIARDAAARLPAPGGPTFIDAPPTGPDLGGDVTTPGEFPPDVGVFPPGVGPPTGTGPPIVIAPPPETSGPDTPPGPPGVPTGGVPEPATWALMLAGFGLLGSALRRRARAQRALR